MQFTPLSYEELQGIEHTVIPEGIYPFKVFDAQEAFSKSSGAPMIKIYLEVIYQGVRRKIIDYLLSGYPTKLANFCHSTGLGEIYKHGTILASDCLDRRGLVKIGIQKDSQRPDGTFYAPRNTVNGYKKAPQSAPELPEDEEIPF